MRKIKTSTLISLFIGITVIAVIFINHTSIAKNSPATVFEGNGFALVELFTSEGCSSCPTADELVAKVQKEVGDKPVYILAYHVDYWDRLGWKDVFSNAAYTKRQNDYARWLNLSQIYTPQIVVNGKTEFVGSQEGALREAIKAGLQDNADVQLNISAATVTGNTVLIQCKVEGKADNAHDVLSLALVQKLAVSKVKSGENGGRTLAHAQIVRSLQSMPLKSSGSTTIALPAGLATRDLEVIGFVQNTGSGAVLAASKRGF